VTLAVTVRRRPPGRAEFVALVAMLFASIAFAIDAMLPALPAIAAELSPAEPNLAQLVLSAFVLGMGAGTLLGGPLADAVGRKAVILGGLALYAGAAAVAARAPSLEVLLAARLLQGFGAAGPRVAAIAMVRDLHAGPRMAQIVSLAMMVFMLVPAAAPAVGQAIIAVAGWRAVFLAFALFALVAGLWLGLRQPETLAPAARRPLRLRPLWQGLRDVLGRPALRASILVQTMVFGALFGTLSSVQPIFAESFARAASFPAWFALIALVSAGASLSNALVVRRIGIYGVVRAALAGVMLLSAAMAGLTLGGLWPPGLAFAGFFLWAVSVFAMASLTVGNLNALALEPLGHVAGLAAAVMLAVPTVLATAIAAPLGLAFDGTPGPLAAGVFACLAVALAVLPQVRPRP
jgi:DHA1 family bicyclomycin/chloramphenicol resistance-like MFS transporter